MLSPFLAHTAPCQARLVRKQCMIQHLQLDGTWWHKFVARCYSLFWFHTQQSRNCIDVEAWLTQLAASWTRTPGTKGTGKLLENPWKCTWEFNPTDHEWWLSFEWRTNTCWGYKKRLIGNVWALDVLRQCMPLNRSVKFGFGQWRSDEGVFQHFEPLPSCWWLLSVLMGAERMLLEKFSNSGAA